MISGNFSEQGKKNHVYGKALQTGKWIEAIRALKDGAQVGYVDPYTGRLDIQMARAGDHNSRPLVSVLENIYRELASLPQASEIVNNVIDKHMRCDLALATPGELCL